MTCSPNNFVGGVLAPLLPLFPGLCLEMRITVDLNFSNPHTKSQLPLKRVYVDWISEVCLTYLRLSGHTASLPYCHLTLGLAH